MSNIKLFNGQEVRTHWDDEKEEWYFSVVDVCAVLSGSAIPRNYWSDLKRKLKAEGSELHEKIVQLKLQSKDGKYYATDVLNTKGIFRLVQSIPSPKAEPFKMWLAQVGADRIEQIVDPEKSFEQAIADYAKKGYSQDWINQRILTIRARKDLTDEWQERGIEDRQDYAILTDEMTAAWSGKSVKGYKKHKGLKKENLRDNMTNLELVLNMLAEITTTEISRDQKPSTFDDSVKVARVDGGIAGNARRDIEQQLGRSVISKSNAGDKLALDESPKSLGIETKKRQSKKDGSGEDGE